MRAAFAPSFALAALLGALVACGYAPLSLWPLALAALAGWIALVERAGGSGWRAFFLGWAFGLGLFTAGNNWIAHAFTYQDAMPHWLGYGAVFALSLYLAVYPGFAALGLMALRRRWPGLPAAPLLAALWIVTEFGRATIFTGFAWNPLGVLWLDTGVEQLAPFVGTYGLGALAILAGGALLALARLRWVRALPVLALLLLVGLWGQGRAAPGERAVDLRIVQPNINQNEKYDPALEQRNFARLATLSGKPSARPRLVLWPEAAVPAWLDMEPLWRARLADLLGPHDLLMTGGVKVYFRERGKAGGLYSERTLIGARNALWVLDPRGRLLSRYDKAHLVPYGEYLPMRSVLEPLGLSRLVPGDADFWPGPGPRSLLLPGAGGRPALKMGVQICYEIIFSGQVVDRAARPDFLFNPSNDAWFGAWGPPQHLAQARLRAVEEGLPVVRSTPTGISALVDARGRLRAHVGHHVAGGVSVRLPGALPPTPFARLGNVLPFLFALGLAGFAVAFSVVSRRATR